MRLNSPVAVENVSHVSKKPQERGGPGNPKPRQIISFQDNNSGILGVIKLVKTIKTFSSYLIGSLVNAVTSYYLMNIIVKLKIHFLFTKFKHFLVVFYSENYR